MPGTIRHELHECIEHGEDEIPVSHEYEQKLDFQIWSKSDTAALHTAPTTAMIGDRKGYSETIELTLEEGSASTMQGMAMG